MLLFFVHLLSLQKRTGKVISVIKFAVLPFPHYYFESSNHK